MHDNKVPGIDSQRGSPPRSRPTAGASPSPDDGPHDEAGAEVQYDDLFGTPALGTDTEDEDEGPGCPFEGLHAPEEPPDPPPLPFTSYSPKRELYEAAFRAAYKYPDALMLVMQGVRKGLKRGKKAAREAAGGQSA
jgi:hypothetical protein